ncbi:MAG: CheR family methyltransferase [Rubrimonas sp.]
MKRAAPITAAEAAAAVASAARQAGPREFPFSEAEFLQIAKILRATAGIDMPAAKEPLVYSRLAKRLRALGLRSFREYCALIADPSSDERIQMLSALTTNVTRFWREPHHFEDLRRKVLPPLVERARAGGRVRIWSAGCSTGQEPYCIAMCVLEALSDAPSRDVKILATDIDPRVLAEGRAGRYPAESLADAPEALWRRTFVDAGDGTMEAGPQLRSLISFRELNLIGEWPMKGPFDVIFCRNVAIYFDEETQNAIWLRMARLLAPGGKLCIGHSERVGGQAASLLNTDGVTAYTRNATQG